MKLNKFIKPMLLNEINQPFDSKEYFFEVKLDGARTIAHLSKENTYLHNKREVDITDTYPELKNLHKQVKGECILDGELVILNSEGKPSFNGLQKRAHLKSQNKITQLVTKLPAKLVVFDILYLNGKDLTSLEFTKRRQTLLDIVTPNEYIEISQGVLEKGIELFDIVRSHNMEGIVAKRLNSTYQIGKRTNDWLKIKNWKDEDFVAIGFTLKDNAPKDLLLAQYDKKSRLILRDSVYFGFSKYDTNLLLDFATTNLSNKPTYDIALKEIDSQMIWIKPVLVCKVEYMLLTKNLGMRQPIFRGFINDKAPTDCKLLDDFYSKYTTLL